MKNKYIFIVVMLTLFTITSSFLWKSNNSKTVTIIPTPSVAAKVSGMPLISPISTVTSIPFAIYDKEKSVITGMFRPQYAKAGYKFTITLPKEWRYVSDDPTKIQLKNEEYTINIRLEYEGFVCNFNNSPESNFYPQANLNYYSDLKLSWESFKIGKRISNSESKQGSFIFCVKDFSNKDVWIGGSKIGLISITAPAKYDKSIVDSAIQIISNITVTEIK